MPHAGGPPTSSAPVSAPPTQTTRDHVIELLTQHYAHDRIALEDFERRTTAVFAARTAAELQAVVADLAVPALPMIVPEHARINAILSSTEQHSTMAMPRHLEIVAVLGNAELDLRDATFADGISIIEVHSVLGNVELTLPSTVRIEMSGDTILGSFASDIASQPDASRSPSHAARLVRVIGRAVLGNVEVATAAPELPAAAPGAALVAGGEAHPAPLQPSLPESR